MDPAALHLPPNNFWVKLQLGPGPTLEEFLTNTSSSRGTYCLSIEKGNLDRDFLGGVPTLPFAVGILIAMI